MSAYLILMALFAVAWSVVGFGVANLCLKLRWNLVGGFLLIALGGILPVVFGTMVFQQGSTHFRMPWFYLLNSFGMTQFSFEVMALASCAGYWLGVVVGAVSGLLPQQTEEGQRERSARVRTTWKLIVLGPLSVAVAWTLFYLADVRAISRLKEIREHHLAILETQEDTAPRQLNDAAQAHDALLLSLMQDQDPDWVLKYLRDAEQRKIRITTTNVELLKIFLPDSQPTAHVRQYVQRHEEELESLRANVLDAGHEYRHWDPAVARFVAVHALMKVRDNEMESALRDLKLLGLMQRQSLDAGVEDSMDFAEIESFRYLVFQAILGQISPVPDAVYEEMLTDMGDIGPAIRRNLKRELSQEVVRSIDNLLANQVSPGKDFKTWYQLAAEHIIYQENIPNNFARLQQRMNAGFLPTADRYPISPMAIFPEIYNDEAWFCTSAAGHYPMQASMYWSGHHTRMELTRAIRFVEQHQRDQGSYPTMPQFVAGTSSPGKLPYVLGYNTLQQGRFGKANGAVVFTPAHRQMEDHLALFLGPMVFQIIDQRAPNANLMWSGTVPTWGTLPAPNDPLKLIVPDRSVQQLESATTDAIRSIQLCRYAEPFLFAYVPKAQGFATAMLAMP